MNRPDHDLGDHLLLTVLGTNPRPARYVLRPSSGEGRAPVGHRAPGQSSQVESKLAPLALLRLLPEDDRPQRVLALCTDKARRDSWPALRDGLPNGCTAERIDIPDGDSAKDVDTFLATVTGAVPESADLTVDLTHGFRHFSILTYVAVLYLATLRNVTIRGAYYGLLKNDAASPFLDLAPLLELPRWVHAIRVLTETGSTKPIATALGRQNGRQEVQRLVGEFDGFSEAYLSGLPLELGSRAWCLSHRQSVKPLRRRLAAVHRLPLADGLIDELAKRIQPHALAEPIRPRRDGWKRRIPLDRDELTRQARLVDTLLGHGNVATALGLMSEWTVSWMAWRLGLEGGWLDYHGARRQAGNVLNAMEAAHDDSALAVRLTKDQGLLARFWKNLRDLRNGYAHHGMRRQDLLDTQERLRPVREYWATLRSLPDFSVGLGQAPEVRLLVSPLGLRPGVLFSALHVARASDGFAGEGPTDLAVICSRESAAHIKEATARARYGGKVSELLLGDAHKGAADIKRVVEAARDGLFGASQVLVNVTGGTTLMGLAAEALASEARRLACPVRRFGLIDRRSGGKQKADPYQIGEAFWLEGWS